MTRPDNHDFLEQPIRKFSLDPLPKMDSGAVVSGAPIGRDIATSDRSRLEAAVPRDRTTDALRGRGDSGLESFSSPTVNFRPADDALSEPPTGVTLTLQTSMSDRRSKEAGRDPATPEIALASAGTTESDLRRDLDAQPPRQEARSALVAESWAGTTTKEDRFFAGADAVGNITERATGGAPLFGSGDSGGTR